MSDDQHHTDPQALARLVRDHEDALWRRGADASDGMSSHHASRRTLPGIVTGDVGVRGAISMELHAIDAEARDHGVLIPRGFGAGGGGGVLLALVVLVLAACSAGLALAFRAAGA